MKAYNQLETGYLELLTIDLQKDKKSAIIVNVGAFIIAIIMAVPMLFFVPISTLYVDENPIFVLIKLGVLTLSLIAYIILHELVHGIAMKICGTKKIKYGFTGLYAFAGSDDYYDKSAYIFIALAPIVLWGVALVLLNIFLPINWFWIIYVIQIMNVSGASGDIYVSFKFCKLPKNILVKDTGLNMTVYGKNI